MEAALAKAFERPLDDVKWAGMLTGDIGRTAALARDDALGTAELTLFHPIKFMLASPAEDAAEIVGRLGPVVWVEDKYDGIRAQLHKRGRDVRLYSRDLHDVTSRLPGGRGAGSRPSPGTGSSTASCSGYRDGEVLPFLSLQTRLGRKTPSAALLAEVPVIFVAFDVLGLGAGRRGARRADSCDMPLEERRRRLDAMALPLADAGGPFALSHLVSADSAEALEAAFAEARARRNEGLMVKDPDSDLLARPAGLRLAEDEEGPGHDRLRRRRRRGRPRQAPRGPVATTRSPCATRPTTGLVTIGKAYSGLTDAEIAEMTRWFEAHTISHHGRYRLVEPTIVVEVAFDVILRSARHKSGFALRFPRIARLRPDKPADEGRHPGHRRAPLPGAPAGRRAPRDGVAPGLGGASGRRHPPRRSQRVLAVDPDG